MEFRILGPVEVMSAGGASVRLGGPKSRTLLAALILRANHTMSLDRLVSAVWDGCPPAKAAATVHSYVSRLRARLAASGGDGQHRISTDPDGYRLRIEPGELDLDLFQVSAERARAAVDAGSRAEAEVEFKQALTLWRGQALADIPAEFARTHAAKLNEARTSLVEEWLGASVHAGRHTEVIPDLRMLVLEHPTREQLAGLLMLALYRAGQQSAALNVYRTTRNALVDDLGVEPGPMLQALHRRVLTNDIELEAPQQRPLAGNHNLPPDLDDFTGRAAELGALCDRDTPSSPRIKVISGMPGVGKTALAVHAAHRLAGQYPDGQLFLDLRAHSSEHPPRDPAAALGALLLALGVPERSIPATLEQRSAVWRTELAARRVVVVLDDVDSWAQIEQLLPGGRNCLVLVTSRSDLVGVPAAQTLPLREFSVWEAAELVRRVIGRRRVDEDEVAVLEAVGLCCCLPLAVRIVAARLRQRPLWRVRYLVARLRQDGQLLGELRVGPLGVSAAFGTSLRRLDPERARMLELLSFHPVDAFGTECAAGFLGLDRTRAERLLESYVDLHLLEVETLGRYRFNRLIRQYARELGGPGTSELVAAGLRRLSDCRNHCHERHAGAIPA